MTATKEYPIDFIKRTHDILEDCYPYFESKDREVTFLLNCLLGLIITIAENEKEPIFKENIDKSFLSLIPDKFGFIDSYEFAKDFTDENLTDVKVLVGHKADLKKKNKLWFIKKIRNGIAHQNIQAINKDENWIGIRLWNMNHGKKDFEIIFSIEELKNFAIEISNKYLSVHHAQQDTPTDGS